VTQSIHSHVYDNGLVLVAEPMDWLDSAAFSLRVPCGAAHDPADRLGLASVLCDMTLRGAGELDSRAFIRELELLGVDHGESVSVSHTSYGGATLAENLPAVLELYADLLLKPQLPGDQLQAARQVVVQELRSVEDEPAQKVMYALREHHYPAPWGRASHGDLPGLTAATMADVRAHWKRQFRPQGTILAVAGRVDWPQLRDQVQRLLGDWQGEELDEPPTGAAGLALDHIAHESNQTQIGIAYRAVPYRHPDYFQCWGAVGVLSGGMSSRLFTEVREKRGLCYSVYATNHTLRDRGAVLCYAGTTADRAQETLDVILGELVRLAQGVEQSELDRLKARIKSALIMQQESSGSRAASIGNDWYHLGRIRPLEELAKIVDELSCQTINRYLAEHPPRDFTVVTLGQQPLEVSVGVS